MKWRKTKDLLRNYGENDKYKYLFYEILFKKFLWNFKNGIYL